MIEQFKIWTFLKKSKVNHENEHPIYFRIYLNGKKFEKSTGLWCNIKNWNKNSQLSRKNHKTNLKIEKLKSEIYESLNSLLDEKKSIDIIDLKNRLNKKTHTPTLLHLVDKHNNEMSLQVPKKYSKGTLKNYFTLRKHLLAFITKSGINQKIKSINHRFIKEFENYLLTNTYNNVNGSIKVLQNLKKITNQALAYGLINEDPFALIKFKKQPFKRGYLSKQEIERIEAIEVIKTTNLVKDLFLFSCYTGLSFRDISLLKTKDINFENDNSIWIKKAREKTKTIYMVPLINRAKEILSKYYIQENILVFKSITNQTLNLHLKKIVENCEINKKVTFHMARHTFATTITLNNNVPIETVSKMLGHSRIRTTQIYAHILENKISHDMKNIMDF